MRKVEKQTAEIWVLAVALLAALAISRGVLRLERSRLPQMAGDHALALLLGDARQQLSQALFDKVDEYFHGGSRTVACERGMWQDDHEHGHGHDHGHDCGSDLCGPRLGLFVDPWTWLNRRIHVQEHRHMGRHEAAELLPWVWAASRVSPGNIQAFLAGSYVLARMVERPHEAARLLEEGIRENPQTPELDCALGELLLTRLRDPAGAEVWFRSALEKCRARGEQADEATREVWLRALFYLGHLARQRGDLDAVRALRQEAATLHAEHVVVRDLGKLLQSEEAAPD